MADVRFDVHVEVAADGIDVVARDWSSRSESSASIHRLAGAALTPGIPIGTRDPRHLSMLLDGEPVTLAPSAGGLTRGSHRVTATWHHLTYQLSPIADGASRFTRDGARLAEFDRVSPTEFKVSWESGVTIVIADAAVGYALAAAFGTGRRGLLAALLDE